MRGHTGSAGQPLPAIIICLLRDTIHWREWSAAALAEAVAEHKPILLSLVTAWSEECAAMDEATYGRAEVVAVAESRFVTVRVDADRRPDLNDRYNLGGWPTTALLTPDGHVLSGGTYLERRRWWRSDAGGRRLARPRRGDSREETRLRPAA